MNWNAANDAFDEFPMVDCNTTTYLQYQDKKTVGLTSKDYPGGGCRMAYCTSNGSITYQGQGGTKIAIRIKPALVNFANITASLAATTWASIFVSQEFSMNRFENSVFGPAIPFILSYTRVNGFGFKKTDAASNVNPIIYNIFLNQQNNRITTKRNNYVTSSTNT